MQLCFSSVLRNSSLSAFSKLLCSQCCFSQDVCWRSHLSFNDMVGTVSLVVISHVCKLTQFKYVLIRELLNFPMLHAKDSLFSNILSENTFYFFLFLLLLHCSLIFQRNCLPAIFSYLGSHI